jgi:transcriptional antiterminator NusG
MTENIKPKIEIKSVEEITADALKQLKDDFLFKQGQWYIIHTYATKEKAVVRDIQIKIDVQHLEDSVFEIVAPTIFDTEVKNGTAKRVEKVRVPSYVLIRMDLSDDLWGTIRYTPNVTGFIGSKNKPIPLTEDEYINFMLPSLIAAELEEQDRLTGGKAKQAATVKAKVNKEDILFNIGDFVNVNIGPFAGYTGTVSEINEDAGKVQVMVEIFGRETPVELDFNQIELSDNN